MTVAVCFEVAFDFRQFRVGKHFHPDLDVELLLVIARWKLDGEAHWGEDKRSLMRAQENR